MTEPILAVEDISKRFGGLYAVRDASLTVEAGRITAVIGPNGAGKTTLFALIAGFQKPDHGRIPLENADITGQPAHRVARQGIARTFQIVQPFAGFRFWKTSPSARTFISHARTRRLPPQRKSQNSSAWKRSWTSPRRP